MDMANWNKGKFHLICIISFLVARSTILWKNSLLVRFNFCMSVARYTLKTHKSDFERKGITGDFLYFLHKYRSSMVEI